MSNEIEGEREGERDREREIDEEEGDVGSKGRQRVLIFNQMHRRRLSRSIRP